MILRPEAYELSGEASGTSIRGPKHPLHSSQRRGSPNIVAPGPTSDDQDTRWSGETLYTLEGVHVFAVPERSDRGHLAMEWTREVWVGTLQVVQKDLNATVRLLNLTLRGRLLVHGGSVEVLDQRSKGIHLASCVAGRAALPVL